MIRPRYSIGIDLGTTNTAVAFVPLDRDEPASFLAIPQLESPETLVEAATLPSFLYLPHDAPPSADRVASALDDRWIIGRLARAQATETPGRVVHSAKSWLAQHRADRSAPFLPWGSDEIDRAEKLSPVGAAALMLRYVREAWNDRCAPSDDANAFDAQKVTITVPASFDAVAQELTLGAARDAGYPATVRLLEEPQAALYAWLERRERAGVPRDFVRDDAHAPHVLVVDIGGGTTDMSLFAFAPNAADGEPRIERIAVSDHLLLGGDNMDLALAHALEPSLCADGENLTGRQWAFLVARCRDLKERALASEGAPDEEFRVSIPGRGSRLIAQSASAQITRAQIERLLLDGFFPACSADEYPLRTAAALRELGLPYARDPAITRHLADFLRDRPTIDGVLFNGGALHPPRLRQRLCEQIGSWQSGAAPIVLENPEPDLAVALGAAYFGKRLATHGQRIGGGAAHAIFLHAQRATDPSDGGADDALVCVLPSGAPTEHTFAITDRTFVLRVNRAVRFAAYSSARHARHGAGDVVRWNERDFQALPPLETSIDVGARAGRSAQTSRDAGGLAQTIPVRLTTRLGELGQLEIACVSADPGIDAAWPLAFNLRDADNRGVGESNGPAPRAALSSGPNVAADALDAAHARMTALFTRPLNPRDKLTATRLLKSLEAILAAPKSSWNVIVVRALWSTLEQCMEQRARSIDHEEAWLILAGFLLRPGFGAPLDESRIDRLWTLRETGLCFAAKTVTIQEYVLWRRVAGGLSHERQARVLAPERAKLREQPNPSPELVLLAGSLERLDLDVKAELIDRFIDLAVVLEREKKHVAHVLSALGSLLNRAPVHAGPEVVVSADFVQRAFDAFGRFDWDGPLRLELQTLFVRAARVVDNRGIDVARSLRARIADKLEKAGVPAAKTAPLRDYMPLQRAERIGSFGESLPPGLILPDDA